MLYRPYLRTDSKLLRFDHMPVYVRGIYCGQCDIGFAPRSSVFPYQVWSTNNPHFIVCIYSQV